MKIGPKSLLLSCLLFCCVGCDQAAKHIAMSTLDQVPHSYLNGTFRLQLSHNPGAFLSLGEGLDTPLRSGLLRWGVAALLFGLLLVSLLTKRTSFLQIVAFAFIVAGGFSNLIDRIRFDGVIDFLNFGIGSLRTGIFNIADMFIVTGATLLAMTSLTREPDQRASPR